MSIVHTSPLNLYIRSTVRTADILSSDSATESAKWTTLTKKEGDHLERRRMPLFPQQSERLAWIRESKRLIEQQKEEGYVDKAILRRLIDTFERADRASRATQNPEPNSKYWALSPNILQEAREVYQLLVGIAKWLRA